MSCMAKAASTSWVSDSISSFHLGRMLYEGHEGLGKDERKGLDYIKKAV